MRSILIILSLILVSCSSNKRHPSSVKSILYIGDSQSEGYLGGMVYDYLKKETHSLNVFGFGSSSPRHWGDPQSSKNSRWLCKRKGRHNGKSGIPIKPFACMGDKLNSAFINLNKDKPELVVFQFLGNSMGFNKKYIHTKVNNLLSALGPEQKCLFITSPPYYKDLKEKNKLRGITQDYFISAIGNRCEVVKGMNAETLKGYAYDRENYLGDRIHLSKKGAAAFFDMIKSSLP